MRSPDRDSQSEPTLGKPAKKGKRTRSKSGKKKVPNAEKPLVSKKKTRRKRRRGTGVERFLDLQAWIEDDDDLVDGDDEDDDGDSKDGDSRPVADLDSDGDEKMLPRRSESSESDEDFL
ncbi:MAG: hypothetical protein P4L61_03820 [Candidatus Pacebacteria bacterium]|nr:hypothetical protein [Candidatus Paceibacterota bacterium]